jgi:hypothetical protein
MLRSLRLAAAATAALTIVGFGTAAQALVIGAYHIFPTPSYKAKLAKEGVPPPAGPVNYYGGSVFTAPRVVSVMWGGSVNPTTVATIPGFSAALVNSTYVDQMAQYDTPSVGINGHKGTNQTIGRGTYFGQVQITPRHKSLSLTDADVQSELKHQIRIGVLPARDLNTVYMVYFPAAVKINLDGAMSCQDFGAYHFATNDSRLSKKNLFYAVEPDCRSGISSIEFAASHEFAEATTDNVPTPGSNPDFPQAWNDASGFEIADLCNSSGTLSAAGVNYTVTQYFLNSTGKCSVGNYTSP